MTETQPRFAFGQWVQAGRYAGQVRQIIWHGKEESHSYWLTVGGKKHSHRYFERDLSPIEDIARWMEENIPDVPQRQIRAVFDDRTIRVYQAYNHAIADAALAAGRFVAPPFKLERMTWIKPSFLWMAYRAGWGFKDEGQARILAIDIAREGFEWALANGCPSHAEPGMDRAEYEALKAKCPVRVQWDPERDLLHRPLPHRAIQIGLTGEAVRRYVEEWTVAISDVTPLAHRIHALVSNQDSPAAEALLPAERPYPDG